jgi:hypothetical protein
MEPFPLLRQWHSEHREHLPALPEYLDAVSYNLEAAQMAESGVGRPGASAWYHSEAGQLYLLGHDTHAIARAGDAAIRCAISALELSLQVMNYTLKVEVPKERVAWSSTDERAGSFRAAVRKVKGADHPVVRAVDRIFASHQYALFKDYRNWTAHRGAPKVLSFWSPGSVIPIARLPPGAVSPDETVLAEANGYILENCRVVSRPFVPSIRALLDDEKGQRAQHVGLGIAVAPGSRMKFKDNYVVVGDPLMNESDYRAANPVDIGGDFVDLAGEKLRVYSARSYGFAVAQAVMFVGMCLMDEWDRQLTNACEDSA